jgi:hypothetical protein
VAANVTDPEFLPRMQTYVLYVLFLLYFGTDAEFAQADRLLLGMVQLLQKSSVFNHPSLHEETTVGSVARAKQESWKMFVHSMLKLLRGDTYVDQDLGRRISFGCLHIHIVRTAAYLAIPRTPLPTAPRYLDYRSSVPRRCHTANESIMENCGFGCTAMS